MTLTIPTLTALVVARNEAAHLPACLKALAFADGIVVVLDRSTDASREIALAHGARVIEGAWPLEGERRQAGADACPEGWVLEIDADERVTPELADEVRRTIAAAPREIVCYPVPVDNYIGTRCVRYGWGASFGKGSSLLLWRTGCKRWGTQRVHPIVIISGGKRGAPLSERLVHYVDENLLDAWERLLRYTELHAQDLHEHGGKPNKPETLGRNIGRFFNRFWKCYVRRKGYREGGYGFVIALCAGLYPLVSYIKAYEGGANNTPRNPL